MLGGRGDACLPASGPSPSEAALVTAPEPFGGAVISPWRISPLEPHIRSQLEVQSSEPHCLKFESQLCHFLSYNLGQVS